VANFVKPYNNDPFVGHLSTPVTTSLSTRTFLSNLPAYRKGISPLLKGLEIGMAHGYFLVGPFDKLGPLRNSDISLLAGFLSAVGLILILTTALLIYGTVSFDSSDKGDDLQTSTGWNQFTGGFLIGAFGGSSFAYLVLLNLPFS
jgi:photosystem I subunit 11